MLGYLILAVLQAAAAWFLSPEVLKFLPPVISGDPRVFAHAAIMAVIVWMVGVLGSLILKDVKMPASTTLVSALIGAMIGAVITVFPQIRELIPLDFHKMLPPLAGAIIGYLIRR